MEIRILRGPDVRRLLPMAECIDLMQRTMIAVSEGRVVLPLRSILVMPGDRGMMGMMPGYLADPECFGVKLVSLIPRNKPPLYSSHLGLVLLFEPEHGQPVALLDAAEITAIRTAAASGLATRLLARADAGDLALLGAGEQARSHLEAMLKVRALRRIRVWARDPAKAKSFAEAQGALHRVVIETSDTVREAIAGADIICTTTKAREPILQGDWLSPGVHLNVVGSSIAAAAEIDTPAVVKSRFFVDCRNSTVNEGGEYLRALRAGAITPEHILGEIGEVANGSKAGRCSPLDMTLYKSLGIAPQDLASAHHILENAPRALGRSLTSSALSLPSAAQVAAARDNIRPFALRTPLLRLNVDLPGANIFLKLENLQPWGSFKIRAAVNVLKNMDGLQLQRGVLTASAGNFGQGLAFAARAMGVSATVVVPSGAAETKVNALIELGAKVIRCSFDEWWTVLTSRACPGEEGVFVHPVAEPGVLAGNATIAAEILEELPGCDAVVVPFGGGGLICGIGSVMRRLRPAVRMVVAESEAAQPAGAALQEGRPVKVPHRQSFVDGMGSTTVLAEMWPLLQAVADQAKCASFEQIADAIRLLAGRHHVIAEAAGAVSVAAALGASGPKGNVVCIVSGGNIDTDKLGAILAGRSPF